MAGDAFFDANEFDCVSQSFLHGAGADVVTTCDPAARVGREFGGGEDVLPDPLLGCLGIFACERVREIDRSVSLTQVTLVDESHSL